ncbi:aspartate aminotransferase family protein [Gaopeijia maritima]|uniref:Aspartate aminotransferase family protein n=1 Tax=Gaopeijia maritima TaxID=3119007 RepID=A0ABU9E6M2_9BACT
MPSLTGTRSTRDALLGVYAPPNEMFVSGEGSWLVEESGRRFLDFTAGIAVNALGYDAPVIRRAVEEALATGMIHTSNLFRTEPAEALAAELVEHTFPGRVFFCNSGAEAGEATFKFARRWAGGGAKHEIVAFRGSFHGRLFGTLAATDRPAYRAPFEPVMPGVRWAEVGDIESVRAVVDRATTAAVVIEPVQGEGGIRPVPDDFLRALRALCDEHEVALIFDEIQCGFGRTGDLFAFESSGVTPDMLSLAKPIAGGFPMGAVVLAPHVADTIAPGDHATTFGGGPLVAHVARAVLRTVAAPAFLDGVRERAARLDAALHELVAAGVGATTVRGRGLMKGVVLNRPAAPVVAAARDEELLVCGAGPDVVRLLPPLNVELAEIDEGIARLQRALEASS